MAEWKECKLGDFADIQTGPFGSQLHAADYVLNGVPSIMPTNIGDRLNIVTDDIVRIAENDAERLERYRVRSGDIVYSRRGDVEKCAFITSEQNGWLCGTGSLRIRFISSEIDPKFCAYYLSTPAIKSWILNNSVGSTMPNLNSSILSNLPLRLPAIRQQQAIAEVLTSLDDKIDLLQRQNKTLEALAQMFFRKWVIENAQPNWNQIPLSEFFDFLEGPGIRNWQYRQTGTRFINIRLIRDGEIDVSKASFVSKDEASGKYKHFLLREHDMVVSTSGTLGKTAIVRDYHLPLLLNTSVIRFRPRDKKSYSFIYQYLKSRVFQDHLEATASGSVQSNFGPTHLRQMKFVLPPKEVMTKYSAEADVIYAKVNLNFRQVRKLGALRDMLLPKLISGEVSVKP